MFKKAIRAYLEGRESLASLERAISSSPDPERARTQAEVELSVEFELKNLYASIPPPPLGLSRAKKALSEIPANKIETDEALSFLGSTARGAFTATPEPPGGFDASLSRLKTKIAAAPPPAARNVVALDVKPAFDEQPVERKLVLLESKRKRGVTKKIVGLPRHYPGSRDVLAAGKDLE